MSFLPSQIILTLVSQMCHSQEITWKVTTDLMQRNKTDKFHTVWSREITSEAEMGNIQCCENIWSHLRSNDDTVAFFIWDLYNIFSYSKATRICLFLQSWWNSDRLSRNRYILMYPQAVLLMSGWAWGHNVNLIEVEPCEQRSMHWEEFSTFAFFRK